MQLPALIFPQTALRASLVARLAPWFQPVRFLTPPSLAEREPGPLEQAGLAQRVRPPQGADQAGGRRAQELAGLLRQWEQWTREQAGSGMLEAVKAGVQPPEPPETVRGLMKEIRRFGEGRPARGDGAPPAADADLLLHLAHVRDREAADMEGILAKVEHGQQELGRALGLEQADSAPADYEELFYERLPPVDYTLDPEKLLPQRLGAWATLAAETPEARGWLATANLPAVQLILERANRRLHSLAHELRSPAGAAMPGPGVAGPPPADSPLAQEAARLVLPDLTGLAPEELAGLGERLTREMGLDGLREELQALLQRLSQQRWSGGLQAEAAAEAQRLGGKCLALAGGHDSRPGLDTRGLSLLVFPGLSREQVLALMHDQEPKDLPAKEDWPDAWPAGSCLMLVAW
jgi:hypothetical protein